jgi:hypothetical protein
VWAEGGLRCCGLVRALGWPCGHTRRYGGKDLSCGAVRVSRKMSQVKSSVRDVDRGDGGEAAA